MLFADALARMNVFADKLADVGQLCAAHARPRLDLVAAYEAAIRIRWCLDHDDDTSLKTNWRVNLQRRNVNERVLKMSPGAKLEVMAMVGALPKAPPRILAADIAAADAVIKQVEYSISSARDREIIRSLASGMSTRAVAGKVGLSQKGIRDRRDAAWAYISAALNSAELPLAA